MPFTAAAPVAMAMRLDISRWARRIRRASVAPNKEGVLEVGLLCKKGGTSDEDAVSANIAEDKNCVAIIVLKYAFGCQYSCDQYIEPVKDWNCICNHKVALVDKPVLFSESAEVRL